MTATRHEPISRFVQTIDVEIRRGSIDLTVSGSDDGQVDATESVDCYISGETLFVRPDGPRSDLEIHIPSTVRTVTLSTGHGDLSLECYIDSIRARTGRGDVSIEGSGRASVVTGIGDIDVGEWSGPMDVRTGAGDISAESVDGRVEAQTGRGDIEISEVPNGAHVSTGSGSVTLNEVGGECSVLVGNGDVEASGMLDANLKVHAGRGDTTVEGRLTGLRVEGGHGSVAIDAELLPGDFSIDLGHGDITVDLPEGSDVRVEAVTSHGRVETDLPLVRVGRPGPAVEFAQRFVGSIGSQNPPSSLRVKTNHGRIRINGSGESTIPYKGDESPRAAKRPDSLLTATERAWAETFKAFGIPIHRDGGASPEATPVADPNEPDSAARPTVDVRSGSPLEMAASVLAADQTPASTPAATPVSAGEGGSAPDQAAILEAVSRGEMSVDEAMRLLSR